jgi:hypothetical protein
MTKTTSAPTATLTFTLTRDTKGALVYAEVDADGNVLDLKDPATVVGSLYVRKNAAVAKGAPQRLTVTVEAKP